MKIKWNPFSCCWEFYTKNGILRCDDSEYEETYAEAEKEEYNLKKN